MENGKPQRVKTALSNNKLAIPAFNPANKGGPPCLMRWDIWQNNPRLVLETRDQALMNPENRFGKIEAAMTALDMYVFTELLRHYANNDVVDKTKLECLGHARSGGEKAKEITAQSSIWIGRDAEKHVYASVINETNEAFPKIKIILGPNDARYSKWYNNDGTPMSKPRMSQLYALAFANMTEDIVGGVLVKTYETPPPPPGGYGNRGGGGGGGYNRGGGGGGGYNRGGGGGSAPPADVKDDDLPF